MSTSIWEVQNRIALEGAVEIPDNSNAPRGPVAWVLSRRELLDMIEQMRSATEIVMDLETTGLDEHAVTGGESNGGVAARIVMAALTLPQADENGIWDGQEPTSFIVPLSHPDSPFLGEWRKVMRLIARAMVQYRKPFVNHHAKFDARWVYACTGIDLTDLIAWDTQTISHLIDETQSTKLKEAAPRRFGIPRWDDHDLSYPGAAEEVDFWELGEYAARDTYWTHRLEQAQLEQLFLDPSDPHAVPLDSDEVKDAKLGRVARYVVTPTAISLGKIEQRGIRLDIDYVRENLAEQRRVSSERLDQLSEMYRLPRDTASTAANAKWFQSLVEQAVSTGDLRVMSMTAKGNPQWDKHVLKKQARWGSETARLILEQRDAAKQAEFYTSWLSKVSPEGYIHSSYRAGHVTTGRLSSADPNMQQVSRKMKRAFIPREGHVFAELDYSQLELRIAAFISRCEPMLEAFRAGQDLHRLFGADIATRRRWKSDPSAAPVALEEVTDEERQQAKAGNFGLLYLQQAQGFRSYADKVYDVELTEEEALEIYEGFFETWEGMHEWHERTIKQARERGYVSSPIGRVRNLPDILSSNTYLSSSAERQAVNAPVQGFGSDLMQMGIANILGVLPGSKRVEGAHPVATVHDSVEIEIEEDRWEEIVEECQERLTNPDPWLRKMECDLDVPLVADATVGRWWGDSSLNK